MLVVCCVLFVRLFVVYAEMVSFVVRYLCVSFALFCLVLVVCCELFVVCRFLFGARCLLFVVRCSLFVLYCVCLFEKNNSELQPSRSYHNK